MQVCILVDAHTPLLSISHLLHQALTRLDADDMYATCVAFAMPYRTFGCCICLAATQQAQEV